MIIYQNVRVGECMVRHKSVLYQAQPKLGIGHPIVVAQWHDMAVDIMCQLILLFLEC